MKKGFIFDGMVAFISVFCLIIAAIVLAYTLSQIKATGDSNFDSSITNAYNGFKGFDSLAPLVVIGIGVALVVSSFLIRSQPIMFVVFFIGNIIFIVVSMMLSNVWHGVFTGNGLSATANDFSNYSAIFENFPIISTVISLLVAVVVFAKGGD